MQSLSISLLEDLENFYKFYEINLKYHQLENKSKSTRNKTSRMADHKIMAVMLIFHLSGYKDFKIFYEVMIKGYLKDIFPNALSYSWFIRIRVRYTLLPSSMPHKRLIC